MGAVERTILHVDLDAFYASVEQRDDPHLRGKPVVVGWPGGRGVVCAASYEARPFGVRSAMSMVEARKRCPHAITVVPRMSHYAKVSESFFGILGRYSPLIEPLSLDEAFVDATGSRKLFGTGEQIAAKIKQDVRAELELVASVGVAPMKFVAKIASDLRKPDGLLVVTTGEVLSFLHPLPVSRLWGVGAVLEGVLLSLGLPTIGEVAVADPQWLASQIGQGQAEHLLGLARGLDERSVIPERESVSIGHEETFERDRRDRADLATVLLAQADEACRRMRAHDLYASVITLKVKYADHTLVTRRRTLSLGTSDGSTVGRELKELLERVPDIEKRGVRLTGVSLSGLSAHAETQLTIPGATPEQDSPARPEKLSRTLDELGSRFGADVVRRAVHLDPKDE